MPPILFLCESLIKVFFPSTARVSHAISNIYLFRINLLMFFSFAPCPEGDNCNNFFPETLTIFKIRCRFSTKTKVPLELQPQKPKDQALLFVFCSDNSYIYQEVFCLAGLDCHHLSLFETKVYWPAATELYAEGWVTKERQWLAHPGCHTKATSSAVEGKAFFFSLYDRVIFGHQRVSFWGSVYSRSLFDPSRLHALNWEGWGWLWSIKDRW